MKINEISDLIAIRNYVQLSQDNYNLRKEHVAELRMILVLLDKKLASTLLGDEFKKFVNFEEGKAAMAEVAAINNIKSGLKKV